jgi:hypothetical protein
MIKSSPPFSLLLLLLEFSPTASSIQKVKCKKEGLTKGFIRGMLLVVGENSNNNK